MLGKYAWDITMKIHPLVSTYVDNAVAQLRRQNLMCFPGGIPHSMQDNTIPEQDGWRGWKCCPSTVSNDELNRLEDETSLKFPTLYRDLLSYQHFISLTEVGLSFERHLPGEWTHKLQSLYFRSWLPERIIKIGLLPFGAETQMDAGPVCFDTRNRQPDGDCPVVFWDHDNIKTDDEIQIMFSSSAKMFECLNIVATNDINFLNHLDEDGEETLPQKQLLLTKFLDADPEGAGGPALKYWTSWGVTKQV